MSNKSLFNFLTIFMMSVYCQNIDSSSGHS